MGKGTGGRRPRRETASARLRIGFLAGLLACVLLTGPAVARAQQGRVSSPAPGIAARGAEGESPDSAAENRPFPQLAAELHTPPDGYSYLVYEWDREAILRSNAFTLLDLLSEVIPGLTAVRASWFGGPHQALDGVFGVGFVTVSIDGRELTSLDAGQVDLTRVPLGSVDHVRVVRLAAGWRAELTTLRRSDARAYSRITGGTGDPGLSRLRLLFSNSAGRHLNFAASADLLDTSGENESDAFEFWGNVEWLPGDGGSGIELHWRSENLTRTAFGSEDLTRREVFLRARGNPAPWLQAEGFAGSTTLESSEKKIRDFDHAGFRLAGSKQVGWFRAGVQVWNSRPYPAADADLAVGARPFGRLGVDVGSRMTAWDGFTTMEVHGGVALDGLPLGGRLAVQAATGSRGVAYPTASLVDSVSYDAASATASFQIGGYRMSETAMYQKVSRQLPFGAAFDSGRGAGSEAKAIAFETEIAGPILPLSWILRDLDPVRVRGGWRHMSSRLPEAPAYFPNNIIRGELFFRDVFFEDQLEVRLGVSLDRRDAMQVAVGPGGAAGTALTLVPSYTFLNFNMMIRVLDVRVYWRYDNMTNQDGQDLPDLLFPRFRTVFGVKWEFLN